MHLRYRVITLFLALISLVGLLSSCNQNTCTPNNPNNPSGETNGGGSEEPEEPYTGPVSALTGFPCTEQAAMARPVSFAVNNEIEYLPEGGFYTVGLCEADVLFETNMEANGSGTRILALFSQESLAKTKRVGSIRSARPYFINLALMADAYYCHDGESSSDDARRSDGSVVPAKEYARWMLRNTGISRLSLYTCAYGGYDGELKDKIGTSDYYNTLCAFGKEILKTFQNTYPHTTYDNVQNRTLFSFGVNKLASAEDCNGVKVFFSDWNNHYTANDFVYDKESGLYEKGQYIYRSMKKRAVAKDADTGKTQEYTNVFVLVTNQYAYDYRYYGEGTALGAPYHIKVDLLNTTGEGYYFSQGKCQKITWKGDTTESPIRYFTEDGKELTVNPGKTYVNLIDSEAADLMELY